MTNVKPIVPTEQRLRLVALTGKGTLVITPEVMAQIRYLCDKMPTVEWSGVLFHTVKGDHTEPEKFECTADFIYPMDKGTSGYTEYKFDGDFLDVYEKKPELLERRMSHIHSHNSMGVFFSGTDNEELGDNAPNYDYYLSLIVNNRGDMCAKVAFVGESTVTTPSYTFTGLRKKNVHIKSEVKKEKVVFTIDMDIYCALDPTFLDKAEEIIKKPSSYHNFGNYAGYQGGATSHQGNSRQHDNGNSNKPARQTKQVVFDGDARSFIVKLIDLDSTAKAFNFWASLTAANRKYNTVEEKMHYKEMITHVYEDIADKTFTGKESIVIAESKIPLLEKCIQIIHNDGGSIQIVKTLKEALNECIEIEKLTAKYNVADLKDEGSQIQMFGLGGEPIE